jgi:hypothetical protein
MIRCTYHNNKWIVEYTARPHKFGFLSNIRIVGNELNASLIRCLKIFYTENDNLGG